METEERFKFRLETVNLIKKNNINIECVKKSISVFDDFLTHNMGRKIEQIDTVSIFKYKSESFEEKYNIVLKVCSFTTIEKIYREVCGGYDTNIDIVSLVNLLHSRQIILDRYCKGSGYLDRIIYLKDVNNRIKEVISFMENNDNGDYDEDTTPVNEEPPISKVEKYNRQIKEVLKPKQIEKMPTQIQTFYLVFPELFKKEGSGSVREINIISLSAGRLVYRELNRSKFVINDKGELENQVENEIRFLDSDKERYFIYSDMNTALDQLTRS